MITTHQLTFGKQVSIGELPTRIKTAHGDKQAGVAEFKLLRQELIGWQEKLYAEGKQKLLIVLQAMDAGGKDGTIRHLFQGVNPQGVQVSSFKVPSHNELAHDFLWRIHQKVPALGTIGVFNRSHYEDVLVVRVDKFVSEQVWRQRYEQINAFEKLLVESGTTVLKFYLHISKEEQQKRLQARIDDPTKHWKFSMEDTNKRKQWDAYMAAYEDLLNYCTTAYAPWYVIPANQKWYRNLAIARVVVAACRQMNPQYPAPQADFSDIIIV